MKNLQKMKKSLRHSLGRRLGRRSKSSYTEKTRGCFSEVFSSLRVGRYDNPVANYTLRLNVVHLNWLRSGVFIVNFEHISHCAVLFLVLTLSR